MLNVSRSFVTPDFSWYHIILRIDQKSKLLQSFYPKTLYESKLMIYEKFTEVCDLQYFHRP